METEQKEQLNNFISQLYSGVFDRNDQRAFENLDRYLIDNEVASDYFKRSLIGFINENRNGSIKLYYTVDCISKYYVPNVAGVVVQALIVIYEKTNDDQILRWLIDTTLSYKLYDLVALENGGLKIRFTSSSILLNTHQIRSDLKLMLFKLLLGKYHNLIVDEAKPRNRFIRENVRRLQNLFGEIYKFGQSEVKTDRKLRPFSFDSNGRIEYTKERALKIIGSEVPAETYDDFIAQQYLIPLMPLVEDSTIEANGDQLHFINEGVGVLPPTSVFISVDNEELLAGKSEKIWFPSDRCTIHIENNISEFLQSKPRSAAVTILLRFEKFGVEYEYQVISDDVGTWLRKVTPKDTYLKITNILQGLSAAQFEKFVCHIVSDKPSEEEPDKKQFKDVNIIAEKGGGDRSQDVVATEVNTGKRFNFQCKHEHVTPSKLDNEMSTFRENMTSGKIEPFDHYRLVTSHAVSPELIDKGKKIATEMGIEFSYWTYTNLENYFKYSPSAQSMIKEL